MPDRSTPSPRPVPATIDAHRVAPVRAGRPTAATAVRATAPVPASAAVHAPVRRRSEAGDAEHARLLRTVDALRRLQSTLSGAQQALDSVIVQVSGAVARESGGADPAVTGARPPVGRVAQRPAGETPAAGLPRPTRR
jgi:hypothetical protein